MGFFDFLKQKPAPLAENQMSFTVENLKPRDLANCKKGGYVNLWVKPDMDKVIIYASNSVGGGGQLGIVPQKYFSAIKKHILGQKDHGFSGPSTNNYKAIISDISSSNISISITLFSHEAHKKIIIEMIERDKEISRAELNKAYNMTRPVEVKFVIKKKSSTKTEDLKLNILDKEFYYENPYNYKLQLVDDTNAVIAETISQKEKVIRIIKGNINGQKMIIQSIKVDGDQFKTVIAAL